MIRPLTCPICQKPVPVAPDDAVKFQPFCSERCRQVDLIRWFDGKYAIVEPLNPELLESEEGASTPGDDSDD
jgi:hypothetical protein